MKTHLTDEEAKLCTLNPDPPYIYRDVTQTQLSIAAFYGKCIINKSVYHYFSDTNELIRRDVLLWKAKRDNAILKQQKHLNDLAQQSLFDQAGQQTSSAA